MSERVPDLMIERLARGELAATQATKVRAALGVDAERRVQAIAADDLETLARLPAARVAATVRGRLADREAPRKSASWWIPAMAFARSSCLKGFASFGKFAPDGNSEYPVAKMIGSFGHSVLIASAS